MDRKKRLMSVLTAIAIFATAFTGILPVSAEDLEAVSLDDVTEAILRDNAGVVTDICSNYSIDKSQAENTITVEITAENVKKHKNAEDTDGYWVGFAVAAPEGVESANVVFGGDTYSGEDTVAIDEDGTMGIAFYINAGAVTPKTEATLQWLDGNDEPVSDETSFAIDLSNVTLANDYTPVISEAKIVDKDDTGRTVYDTYTVSGEDGVVDIDMTKLALHTNGNDEEGYWTGFAVVAHDDAEFVKYSFGETVDAYIPVESAVATVNDEEKDGIAFYTNAAQPQTEVKLQWFDGDGVALSNSIELTMDIDGVEYYQIKAEDVSEAILFDTADEPEEVLCTSYSVVAEQEDDTITVTVSAADLKKHTNVSDAQGYWTGFAVAAPEGVESANVVFGGDTYLDEDIVVIDENGTMGIAFYTNAGAAVPKTTATLQWLDADGNALTEEVDFVIDLSDVTLAVADYTPVVIKANVADYDEVREVYDADSYVIDAETIPGVVAISVTGLKEHTNGSDAQGYWTGFAVEAPNADATQFKYAFGLDKETLTWEAGLYGVEDIDGDAGEKVGVAFFANAADEEPKRFVKLQWFDADGNVLTDEVEFEMNLDGVKLNWISKEKVTLANSTGTAETALTTEQNDGVITVKYSAEALDKHANAEDTQGYWIGFAVEAPDDEAKAKVTFGDYNNENMTLEDIYAEKKGVAFYTNAGAAYPKTEATLQWIDAEGNPLSAPTKFVVDLTDVILAGLPCISAEDVKAAKIVDQANTSVKPYSSYSVSAEENEDGTIAVDISMKSLKSHKNSLNERGHWTGFAVAAPEGAVTMRYAFADNKESLSAMNTAAVETGVVTVDEVEKNGAAFYTNAKNPKKYVRLQWFDENDEAITNATDFEMNLSGVKLYTERSNSNGGGSSSNYYTVLFMTNGGSAVSSARAKKDETISEPASPVKDGFVFDGWYTDKELTQKYDFSTVVTKSFTLYAKWTEKAMSFVDVDSDAWYYNVVREVVKLGLMNGISETEFAPTLDVTRGMFVTILYRAAGAEKTESVSAFEDVPENQYYSDAVAWASAKGIVNGITESLFAPDAKITREQMAVILYRYVKAEAVADEIAYTDKDTISDYALDAVAWANAVGIMKGNEDGTFAPLRNTTRAEAAAVFVRLLDLIK